MAIKQFNGEWVAAEDRILFRVSTSEGQEFLFWLTRHIVKHFLAACRQLSVQTLAQRHPPPVAEAVHAFQQESLVQRLDFQQAYEPQPARPLGDAPALVTGLHMSHAGVEITVDLDTVTGARAHLQLNDDLLRIWVGLLDKLQSVAGWDIAAPDVPVALVTEPASAQVH